MSAGWWIGAAVITTLVAIGFHSASEFIERSWGRRCPACDSHRLRKRSTPGSTLFTVGVLGGLIGLSHAFTDPPPWIAVGLPIAIVLAACAVLAAVVSMFRSHHCRSCGHRWR